MLRFAHVSLQSVFTYFPQELSCKRGSITLLHLRYGFVSQPPASVPPGSQVFDGESSLLLHVDTWLSCHAPGEQQTLSEAFSWQMDISQDQLRLEVAGK